ncbi:MAG: AsmA-like C-terminal region-containing protein [Candidatus Omnitrophota bacterium]
MKRLKIFLAAGLLLVSILAAGLFYANKVFLPKFLSDKIIEGISEFSSSKVTLRSLRLSLLKGIVLSDLTIYEAADPEKQLAHIEELSASFLIWPFFKEQRVILPSLKLKGVSLSLVRQENALNITPLTDKITQKNGKTPAVLVKNLFIWDALILWQDLTFPQPVSASLCLKQAEVKTGVLKTLFSASGSLERDSRQSFFSTDGNYGFREQSLHGRLVLRGLDVKSFPEYLALLPITPRQGILESLEGEITWQPSAAPKPLEGKLQVHFRELEFAFQDYELSEGDASANFSFSGRPDNWASLEAEGGLRLDKGLVKIAIAQPQQDAVTSSPALITSEARLDGSHWEIKRAKDTTQVISELLICGLSLGKDDLKANISRACVQAKTQIPDNAPATFSCQGQAAIDSADIEGLPDLGPVKIHSLSLSFTRDSLVFRQAEAELLGAVVEASGAYQNSLLDINVSSRLPAENLLPLLKERFSTFPVEKFSGQTTLAIRVLSDLKKEHSFSGKAEIEEPAVVFKGRPDEWKASWARIIFDSTKQTAEWLVKGLSYLERSFLIEGKLENFNDPSGEISARSDETALDVRLKKTGQNLDISSLKAETKSSKLEGTGQWNLDTDSLHINANADVNIEDLKDWLPDKKIFEKPLSLKGRCAIQIDTTGPAKNWKAWTVRSTVLSKLLKFHGFSFKDISLNYTQLSGKGFINFLTFQAYGGQAETKGSLDLKQEPLAYQLSGEFKNLDLNLLKNDIPEIKDKVFYGIMGVQAVAKGSGSDPKKIQGQAQISIKNGNIWEFNPLKGLGDFLFIPRFSSLVFSQASGDFYIDDGWVRTDNLELLGEDLGLLIQGKMGLDGSLDLIAMTQVPKTGPETAAQSVGMTGIAITGNMKNTQYKLQPLTRNIMKKLSDILSSITP